MVKDSNSRPRLLNWHFDDEIGTDNPKEWNWIEITMHFTDGSKRWSILYTPERLLNNLSRPNIDPPGLHMQQLIVVRSYEFSDIDRVLKAFDEENRLIEASSDSKEPATSSNIIFMHRAYALGPAEGVRRGRNRPDTSDSVGRREYVNVK